MRKHLLRAIHLLDRMDHQAHLPAKAVLVAIRVCAITVSRRRSPRAYRSSAAKDVSANYDMIIQMFRDLKSFLEQLSVYIQLEITTSLQETVVDTLAQLSMVLGVVTKSIKQKRSGDDRRSRDAPLDILAEVAFEFNTGQRFFWKGYGY